MAAAVAGLLPDLLDMAELAVAVAATTTFPDVAATAAALGASQLVEEEEADSSAVAVPRGAKAASSYFGLRAFKCTPESPTA